MGLSVKAILRWLPAILFGAALAVFFILFFRYQRKPVIRELDRISASSGDKLEILGEHFGNESDGSKLFIGSHALTSTGLLEWSDNRILARVPRNDGAILVKVKTRSGLSEGVVLGDANRFPRVEYGSWLPGAPYVEYAEPQEGAAGTLVTLRGEGFGGRRGGGAILVNRSDPDAPVGSEPPDVGKYLEIQSVERWADDAVSFRIPENAATGNIYIRKGGSFSNPVSFDITDEAGFFIKDNPVTWSLRQEVSVRRIGSFPGNTLYMYIPIPEAGAGQGEALVLESPELSGPNMSAGEWNEKEKDVEFIHETDGLSLYRLEELKPEEIRTISRQLVVTVDRVRASVNIDALEPYDPSNPDIAAALASDSQIKPETVARVASRVVGNIRNDWLKSRAVYDYVAALLDWSDDPPTRVVSDYISSKLADSEGYSFLFCSLARAAGVPSRPVGGCLMDAEGNSRKWWWAEVWIEGLGWVPVDPALGDGAAENFAKSHDEAPEVSEETEIQSPADFYFGGLDNHHIAFSRGIRSSGPTQPSSRPAIPSDHYSLQGAYEEATGNLMSYESLWPVPRPTAVY